MVNTSNTRGGFRGGVMGAASPLYFELVFYVFRIARGRILKQGARRLAKARPDFTILYTLLIIPGA